MSEVSRSYTVIPMIIASALLNPLIPSAANGVVLIAAAAHLVLAVWAVLSILGARAWTFTTQLALAVLAVVVPLAGPLLTLVMSRRARSLDRTNGEVAARSSAL